MGASSPMPIGYEEAKAFTAFMKKFIKNHENQNEDEWNWNGSNAWGKLTIEQKMYFAVRPRGNKTTKRAPVAKAKQAAKPKKVVGRQSISKGRKLTKPQRSTYGKYRKRGPVVRTND